MRVVAVSWRDLAHPQAGGSEVLVDRLLSGLAARGHDVTLVCGGPVGERDYPVYAAGDTYDQYVRAPLLCMTRLRSADIMIDVSNGLPYFSPLWRRAPSVCLMHHNHTDQWETRFPPVVARIAQWAENSLVPRVYARRRFVAVSPSTADALASIGVDRRGISVIENGVEIPGQRARPKAATPLFVALSRLVPHKRIDLLLQAWSSVFPVTGGTFVIIGDGPLLQALRLEYADAPGVVFAGHVSEEEKWRLLEDAWFLVHGALHEGWGLAILEAAAVGTPSVALNAPGVRDAIRDGETGVLVDAPAEKSAEALAGAWIDLSGDPDRRAHMGEEARLWAERFGWDRTVEAWEQLLQNEIASGTHPRRAGRRGPVPTAATGDGVQD